MKHGALVLALIAAAALASVLLFRHLSYPLLWHDEAETAMFARRVLEYGYPKVHAGKNVVFSIFPQRGVGLHEGLDAYTGSPWAQYYVGALGVAAADRRNDLYEKTLLVRLPFALAGAAGVALLALAVLPSLGQGAARRLLFAIAYLLVFGYSISLILHLREARYYPLVVLWVGCFLWLFVARQLRNTLDAWVYVPLQAIVLLALLNTFHVAFAAVCAAQGLYLVAAARADPRPPRDRARTLLRDALPLLLAGAGALPLLAFFDFFEQTVDWVQRLSELTTVPRNLATVVMTLLRYDFLAPALVLHAIAVALLRRAPSGVLPSELRQRIAIARFLSMLLLCYALVVAQVPFLFERYFVVLSPLVTLLLLLDAFTVYDLLRQPGLSRRARRAALAGTALAGVCLAVGAWLRIPEFGGRLLEIRQPYRGPLDFVIPYLAEKYPDIGDRVIATNYEGPAFMFYLDSQVTIGFYGAALERDLAIQPDVIVPRSWPERSRLLRRLAERVPYEVTRFPVANLPWNNLPSLSPFRTYAVAHRFVTERPRTPGEALVVLERIPAPR